MRRHTLIALVLIAAATLLATGPAASAASTTTTKAAAQPCWERLMADWEDGTINNVYPVKCYRQAIANMPPDVAIYSSARDDIQRAMEAVIAGQKVIPKETSPGAGGVLASPTGGAPITVTDNGVGSNKTQKKGIAKAIAKITPGGSEAFPLPLLILGALAIILIAAGGVGVLLRRFQDGGPGATA